MKKNHLRVFSLVLILVLAVALGVLLSLLSYPKSENRAPNIKTSPLWPIRSVDTVKYSRDLARENLNNSAFDTVIDKQVKDIAQSGASYIAIGTPYDEEFYPYLRRWVKAARANNLSVWFRGNFSGWERWFDYPKIDRQTHLQKLEKFILDNPDLFEDGDIFTPCPECENGGAGDPRLTGDVVGFRQFLIDEYRVSHESFKQIKKAVNTGFFSMNYDVANLVMDPHTTKAVGNFVVIDHYVKTPEKLAEDVDLIAKKSGGNVILGEFGVPIPDINGEMSEDQQAEWLRKALMLLDEEESLKGLNYWVSVGGSTQLWNDNGTPRLGETILKDYYTATEPTK